jgi:hypothetical protein
VTRRLRALICIATAFVVLTAGECEIGDIGNILARPGTITVTNTGDTETAVVAILADDVKSYPTLASGSSASVKTNVGGAYQVRVVMTPENAQRYRDNLNSLKQLVQKQVDGTATTQEKTRLFSDLAGINAAIKALEQANAAGCSGNLALSPDEALTASATIAWVPQAGAGFWDTTCPSN